MKRGFDWLLIIILLFVLGMATVMYYYLLLPQNGFLWDEANHTQRVWSLLQPLRQQNWREVLKAINSQTVYPPFYPIIVAPLLLLFGDSIISVKLTGLVFFFFSALLLYLIPSQLLAKKEGKIAGLMAVLLFSTAPIILSQFTQGLTESLGLVLTLSLVFLYLLRLNRPSITTAILIALVATLLFLTKYNFGLAAIATLVLNEISYQLWPEKQTRLIHGKFSLTLFLLLLVFLGLWFFAGNTEAKIAGIVQTSENPVYFTPLSGTNWLSILDKILYYPRAIWTSYTFSLWIGLGLILALFSTLRFFAQAKYRFLILFFWLNFLPLVLKYNFNMQDRYIFTFVPLLYLLFSAEAITLSKHLAKKPKTIIGLGFLSLIILSDIVFLPFSAKPLTNYVSRAFVYSTPINTDQTIKIPFLFGLPRPSFFLPHLPKHNSGNPQVKFPEVLKHSNLSIFQFIDDNVKQEEPISIMFVFNEFSPGLIAWYARYRPSPVFVSEIHPETKFVLGIEVSPISPYYSGDYLFNHAQKNQEARVKLNQSLEFQLDKKQEFADLGIQIFLFQRRK